MEIARVVAGTVSMSDSDVNTCVTSKCCDVCAVGVELMELIGKLVNDRGELGSELGMELRLEESG